MQQYINYIIWGVVGLVAGFLASQLVNRKGEGLIRDIILGLIGAYLGGFIMRAVWPGREIGLDIPSILVATGGAIVVLLIFHALLRLARRVV